MSDQKKAGARPLSYPVLGDNGSPMVEVNPFAGGVWSEYGRLHLSMSPMEARRYAMALTACADMAEQLEQKRAGSAS